MGEGVKLKWHTKSELIRNFWLTQKIRISAQLNQLVKLLA